MPVLMPEPKNTLLGKDTVYSDRYGLASTDSARTRARCHRRP